MQKHTVYGLIKENMFSEAIKLADEELLENPNNVFIMRNKVLALLNLRHYREVILLSEVIIKLRNGETESDFINLGIAKWFYDEKDSAIKNWIKGEW